MRNERQKEQNHLSSRTRHDQGGSFGELTTTLRARESASHELAYGSPFPYLPDSVPSYAQMRSHRAVETPQGQRAVLLRSKKTDACMQPRMHQSGPIPFPFPVSRQATN